MSDYNKIKKVHPDNNYDERNDFFSSVENSLQAGIIIFDKNGILNYVNDYFVKMLGWSREELIGKSHPFAYWPENKIRQMNILFRHLIDGKFHGKEFELEFISKDGVLIDVKVVISGLKNAEDENTGWLVLVNYISEITDAGETSIEDDAMRHSIIQASDDGFCRVDLEWRILEVNNRYCRMTGYSEQELLTMTIADLDAVHTPDQINMHYEKVLQTGSDRFETNHRCRDGSVVPVDVSIQFAPFGKGFLVVFLRDITERNISQKILKNSEEKLTQITDNIPVFISVVNKELEYLFINNTYCRFFKLAKDQLLGRKVKDIIGEAPFSRAYPYILKALSGETVTFENSVTNREQKNVIIQTTYTPFYQNEVISGLIILIVDITERKKTEEKINTLLLEKDLILKEVHHRIKNNMNTIYSFLMVQAVDQESHALKNILRDAAGRVQSMNILYDKLYLSELNGKMSAKEYLPYLIYEIAAIFPQNTSVKIKTQIDDIIMDADLLSHLGILLNEFITNSMKYAFGGINDACLTVKLSLNSESIKSSAVLTFEDNGIGMPESVTLENTVGFGLQLIDKLVTKLNGSVRIERHSGTRFIVEFPV